MKILVFWIIKTIWRTVPPPPVFTIAIQEVAKKGEKMPAEITATNEQNQRIEVTPKTKKGKPARIDGAVSFSLVGQDDGTVTLTQDGDAATLVNIPENFAGDITVAFEADAKIGEGVVEIQDTVLFHINDPEAENFDINVTPVDRPA